MEGSNPPLQSGYCPFFFSKTGGGQDNLGLSGGIGQKEILYYQKRQAIQTFFHPGPVRIAAERILPAI